MDKQQLRKNRLDLEYHGEAQKANAFLILLTTGILAFLGTFVWLNDSTLFGYGLMITAFVAAAGIILYLKSTTRMEEILNEIERI